MVSPLTVLHCTLTSPVIDWSAAQCVDGPLWPYFLIKPILTAALVAYTNILSNITIQPAIARLPLYLKYYFNIYLQRLKLERLKLDPLWNREHYESNSLKTVFLCWFHSKQTKTHRFCLTFDGILWCFDNEYVLSLMNAVALNNLLSL